jgi:hypothetical protein
MLRVVRACVHALNRNGDRDVCLFVRLLGVED